MSNWINWFFGISFVRRCAVVGLICAFLFIINAWTACFVSPGLMGAFVAQGVLLAIGMLVCLLCAVFHEV
jgi:hypothetical protein